MEISGGDLDSIYIFGRGERPPDYHVSSWGHPRLYFKHPPCFPRWIKLARGQLWHGLIFMDISLNVTF